MADEDTDDKPYEPTAKKLEDARKRGEIVKSTDLLAAANYGGFVLAVMGAGAFGLQALGAELAGLLARSWQVSDNLFSQGGTAQLTGTVSNAVLACLPFFFVPALAVLLAILAQRSLVFTPDKIAPKLSRISVLSNLKNKFGRAGLFEFGKSTVKLCVYGVLLAVLLNSNLEAVLALPGLGFQDVLGVLMRLISQFLILAFVATAVLGGIDYFWQLQEHLRKNRMSHQEMVDENKQSEGDPHLKNQRRQKGYEIAMGQMLADVPEADVIMVNPTHYAVALKWDRLSGRAPVCVAKGVDHIAAKIRETAQEAGVPIHRDPPTARALFAQIEIGEEIHPEHFEPVAAAIRFAERMKQKARGFAT